MSFIEGKKLSNMKKSAREVSPQEGKFLVSESRKVFVSFKVAAKEISWKLKAKILRVP